jgi:hypothetical protein
MNMSEVQTRFMSHLKKVVPPGISLVKELADVLGLSIDAAYRRMRGETDLSVDEAVALCRHFRVSPTVLFQGSDQFVTFSYKSMGTATDSLTEYLQSVESDLRNALSFETVHLFFAAEDIPVFHHLDYEFLTPFKFFYWKKAILNLPQLAGQKFDRNAISAETLEMAKRISKLYIHIPSTEIWTEETIGSTLSQVQYFWESGNFRSRGDALRVLEDMELLISRLAAQAEAGGKMAINQQETAFPGNFKLYASEVQIGNNSLLVQTEKLKISLLSFNTFNSLLTFNLNYCLENERWIQNLIRKSVLISEVSEKHRFRFFRRMSAMVDALKKRILADA